MRRSTLTSAFRRARSPEKDLRLCVDYGALWRTPSPSATPPEYYAHQIRLDTGVDV